MTYIEGRGFKMTKTKFLKKSNYYLNKLLSPKRLFNKIWQSFWLFIQFLFETGDFVLRLISVIYEYVEIVYMYICEILS